MLVPSRVAANCRVKGKTNDITCEDLAESYRDFAVLDWDRLGKSDRLGTGQIDLVSIEPFQATSQTIYLKTSDGEQHGQINIRMVFRPEVCRKKRNECEMSVLIF
jgi:Ca2+-dependent lipid-binding protein